MNKTDYMAALNAKYDNRVGEATKQGNIVGGITTYNAPIFVRVGSNAKWATEIFYVLDEGEPTEEAVPAIEEVESQFSKNIKTAIAAKKTAGTYWTAKIQTIDEDEGYADVIVSVPTAKALQVEEQTVRLKSNPANPSEIIFSRKVDTLKQSWIEKLKSADTVVVNEV